MVPGRAWFATARCAVNGYAHNTGEVPVAASGTEEACRPGPRGPRATRDEGHVFDQISR
jgi:hypothetical protein